SNEVDQTSSILSRRRGWPSPDPGFRALVQLPGGDPRGQVDLRRIGEGLAGECRPAKRPPPGFLEIQPAGALPDEDRAHARVRRQPFPDRRALVAGEVVADDVEVAVRVVLVDDAQQAQVAGGVAGGGGEGARLPVAHPQGAVDPDLLRAPAIFERRLDAMP